ncbi:hypothetical protein GCM10027047_00140 [Rhodococcus aerolatus]
MSSVNQQVFDTVNGFARSSGWLHPVAVGYAKYGVVLFGLLLVAGLLVARRSGDRTVAAAVWAVVSVPVAVALNQPVVALVHGPRPYTVHPDALTLIDRSSDPSFPSDHATMAGAAVVGLLLVSRRLGGVTAVLAVLMAAARVYVGVHYPGDVLAGLAVGAVVAGVGWVLLRGPATRLAGWGRGRAGLAAVLGAPQPPRPARPVTADT